MISTAIPPPREVQPPEGNTMMAEHIHTSYAANTKAVFYSESLESPLVPCLVSDTTESSIGGNLGGIST